MSSSQQGTAARKQPMKLNTLVTLMLSAVIVLVLLSVHMF